jgi:hypothetical protein
VRSRNVLPFRRRNAIGRDDHFRNLTEVIMDISILLANYLIRPIGKRLPYRYEPVAPLCLRLVLGLAAFAALLMGLDLAARA